MLRDFSDALTLFVATLAALGGFLFGRMDGVLIMLLTFAALDYLLGSAVACRDQGIAGWDRDTAVTGFTRKLAMLAPVIVANMVGQQLGDNGVLRGLTILGYAYIEGTSIMRNVKLLGVDVPAGLQAGLERLKPADGGSGEERRL